jgi:Cu2+-exporting ATPase
MHAQPRSVEQNVCAGVASVEVRTCYHCGDPIPAGLEFALTIDGRCRQMCCAGCAAVAQTIVEAGLTDYYRLRTSTANSAQDRVPRILQQAAVYAQPATQSFYSRDLGTGQREASLILEDIECAACAWLVERTLAKQAGVIEAAVNFSTHRARVRWDSRECTLGTLMAAVARIGYRAQPYDAARSDAALRLEGQARLRRLGIAGLFGMQVMMVAVVLYSGGWSGMDPTFFTLFRWLSLILTIPILVYSAWPFFIAAARGVRHGSPGMDLPVSIGLLIAFTASVHATVVGQGHVYFDAVAMFTFFLQLARYLEFLARKRAQQATEALVLPVPEFAHRINATADTVEPARESTDHTLADGPAIDTSLVAVAELVPGDRVRILPGECIPADGVITVGSGSVDESLLCGESRPTAREVGDDVHAGTINRGSALEIRVLRVGADMVISRVLSLVANASESRPRLALLAERVASVFVLGVVLIAVAVALYWWHVDPATWLSATIAVLVVTCPCALSLATPAAMTAAAGALTRHGLLPARGLALEALARVDHLVFDKTGTLTTGNYRVQNTQVLGTANSTTLLRAAAALERYSEHPIARAIDKVAPGLTPAASDVRSYPGQGISGTIDSQRWYLGAPAWVCRQAKIECPDLGALDHMGDRMGATVVMIANDDSALGAFALGDELRDGAAQLVDALLSKGIAVSMYSGDTSKAVQNIADQLGIVDRAGGLLPQDKLKRLIALQTAGHTTAMVGDGINDAPVLAAASVSIAMGGGAQAARASADFILVNEQLPTIIKAIEIAHRSRRIMRQNMAWALAYNLLALPIAAAGWVAPWMAALGMSCSALLVVANSLRLLPSRAAKNTAAHEAQAS